MIDGVVIKNLIERKDIPDLEQKGVEPGFLLEILRADDSFFKKFGQSTMTVANAGTVKAFHYHERQDDLWFAATGRAAIVLHDLRENVPSYKKTEVIYAGKNDYKLVVIPMGVAHGYKVVSEEPVLMFYHTTEPYNPQSPDEKRIAFDDPKIGFDWNKV